MKNCNEMVNSLLERREQYETEKIKKRKRLTRTLTPICCLCLVALLGLGARQGGWFEKQPIQTAEDAVIPGTKDWYGPGEEKPTTTANTQTPIENTIANNNQIGNTDNQQIPEDNKESATTNFKNNNSQVANDNEFGETSWVDSYVYEIEEGEYSEYFAGKVIEKSKVGDKVADVTLVAGWKTVSDGEWATQEKLHGEIFLINGVEKDIAVALRFIDKGEAVTTTHYYVMMNPNADLSAVEEYIIPLPTDNGEEMALE